MPYAPRYTEGMNATRLVTIALAASLLAGCGNKGPLVLPTPPAESTPVEGPTEAPPAEATPPETTPPAQPASDSQATPPPEVPADPPVPASGNPSGNG